MDSPPSPPEAPPEAAPAATRFFGLNTTTKVLLGLLIAILIAGILLVAGAARLVRKMQARDDAYPQVSDHFQQLSKALSDFHILYHSFPHADTAAAMKQDSGTPLTLGASTSNQLFRQLLATGRITSEAPFWLKTPGSPKPPDDNFSSDSTALARGECGIAYVAGLSKQDDYGLPLLIAPLVPGKLAFDPEALHGIAYVLSVDGKISTYTIDNDGHVYRGDKDFFDPIFWGGKAPDIKWPE